MKTQINRAAGDGRSAVRPTQAVGVRGRPVRGMRPIHYDPVMRRGIRILRLVLAGALIVPALALLAAWPLSMSREYSAAAVVRATTTHDVFCGARLTRGRLVLKSYWGVIDPHGSSWPRSYAQNYFALAPGESLAFVMTDQVGTTVWNQQPWYRPYLEAHLQRPVVNTALQVGELVFSVHDAVLAALLLLLAAVMGLGPARRALRRRYRIKSNLCLHCGYKLKGVEADHCPECGAVRPVFTFAHDDR